MRDKGITISQNKNKSNKFLTVECGGFVVFRSDLQSIQFTIAAIIVCINGTVKAGVEK